MEKIFGMKSSEFLKMHGTFLGSCNRDRIKSDKHSLWKLCMHVILFSLFLLTILLSSSIVRFVIINFACNDASSNSAHRWLPVAVKFSWCHNPGQSIAICVIVERFYASELRFRHFALCNLTECRKTMIVS